MKDRVKRIDELDTIYDRLCFIREVLDVVSMPRLAGRVDSVIESVSMLRAGLVNDELDDYHSSRTPTDAP